MTTITQTTTCDWPGRSGKTYRYHVYPIGNPMRAAAGNYIFAKLDGFRRWVPVYIGQTGNLNERFDQHHKAGCILRAGATHIHAHLTPGGETVRLAEEADLLAMFATACNG